MHSNTIIAILLALIFVAIAWRFLLGALLLGLVALMWVLLFKFCLGVIQGVREFAKEGPSL